MPLLLRQREIKNLLEHNHLTMGDVAKRLRISRSYFSLLVHGHRQPSPRLRRRILSCAPFKGHPESALWECRDEAER